MDLFNLKNVQIAAFLIKLRLKYNMHLVILSIYDKHM